VEDVLSYVSDLLSLGEHWVLQQQAGTYRGQIEKAVAKFCRCVRVCSACMSEDSQRHHVSQSLQQDMQHLFTGIQADT
jgi:hypothetical protein